MSLLRINAMSLLAVALLQAALTASLFQSGAGLDISWDRLARGWPSGAEDPASLLALASDRAADEATEPVAGPISAEQALPPLATFLLDIFARLDSSDLPSPRPPR